MPDETTISETFIGAPLLLLVTTIVSVVTQTREARKRITAEKRLAYERAYAAEQSFSFDQDHWICETEAGNQEIPWTALQVAANGKVFFI